MPSSHLSLSNHQQLNMGFFTATRQSESLVKPSEPTPSETLELSILDRAPGLRHQVRSLHVFKHGQQPTKVIREALAKALVPYYPFAGRFAVSADHGEMVVECTGEGAWFVEATANCCLEDVNYLDHPFLIPQDELMPSPRVEGEVLDIPLLMQVTEFKCGGFIVGIISVHTIADGLSAAQFVKAIGDLARNHPQPTTTPVWSRHLIPNPPPLPRGPPPRFPSLHLQYTTFNLPLHQITRTKSLHLDLTGRHCSTFDISVAALWRARARALSLDPETPLRLIFFASVRQLLPLEAGFYGNCFLPVIVTAPSKAIVHAEIVDVVRLIREGKAKLPDEFAKWARGEYTRDPFEFGFDYKTMFVSDWTQLGFLDVDYGWGKPVHVIPFAYYDFMPVAILGRPLAPKKGAWLMTQCVKKEHLRAFEEEVNSLA